MTLCLKGNVAGGVGGIKDKVNKIQKEEVRCIKQSYIVMSLMNVCFSSIPLIVILTTFAVYVYSDMTTNVLTAEKVFVSVSIFNILRIPLYLFPTFFMEAVKLMVSLRRINAFLNSENLTTG